MRGITAHLLHKAETVTHLVSKSTVADATAIGDIDQITREGDAGVAIAVVNNGCFRRVWTVRGRPGYACINVQDSWRHAVAFD